MINNHIKEVYSKLLQDYFLCPRKSFTGKMRYGVFDQKMNVVTTISDKQFRVLKEVVVKKKDRFVLSKRQVRSLHGNNYFKKTYLTFYHGDKEKI
jgi:hypothetical protein